MATNIPNKCEEINKQSVEEYWEGFDKNLRFKMQNDFSNFENIAQTALLRNKSSSDCSTCKKQNYLKEECERKRRFREFLNAERKRIMHQKVRLRTMKTTGRSRRRMCQFKNIPEPLSSEKSTRSCCKIPKVTPKKAGILRKIRKCRQEPKQRSIMVQIELPRPCCSNICNSNEKGEIKMCEKDPNIELKATKRGKNKKPKKLKTWFKKTANSTQTQTKMVEQAVEACFSIIINQETEKSSRDLDNKNDKLQTADKKIFCCIINQNKQNQKKGKKRLRKKNKISFKQVPNSTMYAHVSTCSCLTQTVSNTDSSMESIDEIKKKTNCFSQQKFDKNCQGKCSMCFSSPLEEEENININYPQWKMNNSLRSLLCNYFDFTTSKCIKAEERSQSVGDCFKEFAPYDAAPWPTPTSCPFYRALRGLQIKYVTARNSGHYKKGLEAIVIKVAELETRMSYGSLMSSFEEQEIENREELLEFGDEQGFESKSKDKICCNCMKLHTTLKTIEGLQKSLCFPVLLESQRILMNEIVNNIYQCKHKCARSVFGTEDLHLPLSKPKENYENHQGPENFDKGTVDNGDIQTQGVDISCYCFDEKNDSSLKSSFTNRSLRQESETGTHHEDSWIEPDCCNSLSSLLYCPLFRVLSGRSYKKSIDCFKIEDPSNYTLEENKINREVRNHVLNIPNQSSSDDSMLSDNQSGSFTIRSSSTLSWESNESDVLSSVDEDTELWNYPRLRGGENKDEEVSKDNKIEENLSDNQPLPEQQQNSSVIHSLGSLFTQELLDNLTNYVNNFNLFAQSGSKVTEHSLLQCQNNGGNLKEIEGSLLVNNVENKVVEFSQAESRSKLYHLPNIETELQNIIRYISIQAKDLELLVQSLDDKQVYQPKRELLVQSPDDKMNSLIEIATRSEECNKQKFHSERELLCTDYTGGCSQTRDSIKSSSSQNQLMEEESQSISTRRLLNTKIGNTSAFKKSDIKEDKVNKRGSIKIKKSGIKSNKKSNVNCSDKGRNKNNKLLNFKRSSTSSNVFINIFREIVRTTKFNEETLRTLKNEFWLNPKTLKFVENSDVYVIPRSFLLQNEELSNLCGQTIEEVKIHSNESPRFKNNNKLLQEKLQESSIVRERFPFQNFKTDTNPFLEDMSFEEILPVPQLNMECTHKVKDFRQSDIMFKLKEFGRKVDDSFQQPDMLNKKNSSIKLLKFDDKSGKEPSQERRIDHKAIAVQENLLNDKFNNRLEENRSKVVKQQKCMKSCAVGPSSVDIYQQIKQKKMMSRTLKHKVSINKYLRKPSISRRTSDTFSFINSLTNSDVSSFRLREVNSHFELGVPISINNNKLNWKKLITKYLNRKSSIGSEWLDENDEMENNFTRRTCPSIRGSKRVTNGNKSSNHIGRYFKGNKIKCYEKIKDDSSCSNRVKQNDYLHPDWIGTQAKSRGLMEFVDKTDPKNLNELPNDVQMKDVMQKSFLTEFFMRSRVATQCAGIFKNIWRDTDIQTSASLIDNATKPTQCEIDKSNKGEQCSLKEQEDVRSCYIPQRGDYISLQSDSSNIGNSKRTSLPEHYRNPFSSVESTANKIDSNVKCSSNEVKKNNDIKDNIDTTVSKGDGHTPKEVVVIFKKSDNVRMHHSDDVCEENDINKRLHGSDKTEFPHVNFNARKHNGGQVFENTTDHHAKRNDSAKRCESDGLRRAKMECRYNQTKEESITPDAQSRKHSTRAQPKTQPDRLRMIGGVNECTTCDCKPKRIPSVCISSRDRSCSVENKHIPVRTISHSCSEKFDRCLQGRTFNCPAGTPLVKVDVKLQDSVAKEPIPEREATRSTSVGSAVFEIGDNTGKYCKSSLSNTDGNKECNGKKKKGLFKCCKKKKANTSEFSESADKCIQAMGLLDRKAQTVEGNERKEGDVIERKRSKKGKAKKKKDKNKKDSLKQSIDSEDDYKILLTCRPVGTGTKNRKDKTKIRLLNCSESTSLDHSEDLSDDSDSYQKKTTKRFKFSTNKKNMNENEKDILKSDDIKGRQNNNSLSETDSENTFLLKCIDKMSKKRSKKGGPKDLLRKMFNRERGGDGRNDKDKDDKTKRKFIKQKNTNNEVHSTSDVNDDSTNGLESRDSSCICVEVAASRHQQKTEGIHEKPTEGIRERCKNRKRLCMCKQSPHEQRKGIRKYIRTCNCHNHNHSHKYNSDHGKKYNLQNGHRKRIAVDVDGDKNNNNGLRSKNEDFMDKSLVRVKIPKSRNNQKPQRSFAQEARKVLAEKSAQCITAPYSGPENSPLIFNRYNVEEFFTPCDDYTSFTPRNNVRQQNIYVPSPNTPPEKENSFSYQHFNTIQPRFVQNYDHYPTSGAYSKYENHAYPYAGNAQKFCNNHSCNNRNGIGNNRTQPKLARDENIKYSRYQMPSNGNRNAPLDANIPSNRIYSNCTCASKPRTQVNNDITDEESMSSATSRRTDRRRGISRYYPCTCFDKIPPRERPFARHPHNVINNTDSYSQTNRKVPRRKVKYDESDASLDSRSDDQRQFLDNECLRGDRRHERDPREKKNHHRKYYDDRRDQDDESEYYRKRTHRYPCYDDYF